MGSSATVYSAQDRREIEAIIAAQEAQPGYNRVPQPTYAPTSQAQQERDNGNNGNLFGYAYSGPAYQNAPNGAQVQRAFLGGSPAPGDDRGRGFGQKAGDVIGSVAGMIFKPINAVGNFGVNTLRGIQDSTDIQGLSVGYRQNPGMSYGRQANNFSFNGSFNMGGGNSRNRSGSVYGDGWGRSSNVNLRATEPQTPWNSGYFNDKLSLFGTAPNAKGHTNIAGVKGIFNKKEAAGAAFLMGYKNAVRDADSIEDLLEQNKRSGGGELHIPESNIARLHITQSVLEAAMKHAANNPDDYNGYMYTHIAGKEYQREIGESSSPWKIRPIQDKETMDAILIAYGNASGSNKALKAFKDIVDNSRNEKEMQQELEVFSSNERWATYSVLNNTQKSAYNILSSKEFTDPDAYATQYALLTNASIWKDNEGVVTDTKAQAFGIYQKGNGFVLRVKDGDDKHEIAIPAHKLEETFALVGKLSIADVKKDANFKDVAPQMIDLVEGYGASGAEFISFTRDTVTNLEKKAKAKKLADEQKAQEAKDQADKEEAIKTARLSEIETELQNITARQEEIAKYNLQSTNASNPLHEFEGYLPGDNELSDKKVKLLEEKAKLNGETFDIEKSKDFIEADNAVILAKAHHQTMADNAVEAQNNYDEANDKLTALKADLKSYEQQYNSIGLVAKPTKLFEMIPPVILARSVKGQFNKNDLEKTINRLQQDIISLEPEIHELQASLAQANTVKAQAQSDLNIAETALGKISPAALEEQKSVESKEYRALTNNDNEQDSANTPKPTAQQIDATANGIINGLRMSSVVRVGESLGQFDATKTKAEIVAGLKKYDPSQGSAPIDEAILKLETKLQDKKVNFTPEMRGAIVRTVRDNLGIDLSNKLLSYNESQIPQNQQQSFNPSSDMQNLNAGQQLLS